ncbi:Nitrilase/cyanide hydratase and apolipoprotein N- acyltransferase [Kribbella flavida DSM 17836]|uniref:Nitrilase/cyanide hydratase and apolipoprotein N-acyltransferase n=1 Tax=Kribbella flavida (strain DSM 17836 / JCM 10339 / NBRC 14399) TaxID=479435 RepID=D2Q1D8_KRIFD|nr:nitrilase family protein [Kribbella flavida]ADB30126.1 Nitrilase/cyanide hydratase and apolipoprotein N- acyltransferase [Kribbella flavida DSM 17836]
MLRTAVVQFEPVPDDPETNLSTVRRLAQQAVDQGAQLVVFPEMCLLGYWHLRRHPAARLHELAEPRTGPGISAVRALARELGAGLGVGWLEADAGRLFNAYAVCLPDGELHVHRKLHAFEHEAISSGDGFTVFDTPWQVRVGILICWDNNLVENVRATALLGATVLLAPHQTGGTRSRSPHGMKPIPVEVWHRRAEDPAAVEAAFNGPNGRGWLMRWLPARAHDNGLFVLFSNGVGQDDDELRTGNSMVIDPYGRIVAETPVPAEAVVVADLDLDLVPASTGQRWLRGRRPELYAVLTERRGDELSPREVRFGRPR